VSRFLIVRTSWPVVLFLLATLEPSDAAVSCLITTERPARTFYLGERPVLNVHANCASMEVPYEVGDYDGSVVARGIMSLSADRPEVLELRPMQCGLYSLTLHFGEETVRDAFCVIPRPGLAKGDPGLWGFQNSPMEEERYRLIAQMGGRYLRFDISWPDYERKKGVFVRTRPDWFAAAGRKFGLQMIPTLGYTTSWACLPPDDMSPVRTHTFAPKELDHWRIYVEAMRDILAPQTLTWPSPEVDRGGVETLPLVRSWEIWNEADQNYYYGPWARYVDLLRIAACALKQNNHHEKVIYGGSCAHWTEMGRTYAMNGQYYFDQISWHSNFDIHTQTLGYYYGVPQLGYRHWLPCRTVQTECYPSIPAGVPPGEYVLRLYATLKAWREEGYCYSLIGLPLIGKEAPTVPAFTYRNTTGQIVPKAMYVGYAATVNLLSEAAYIGPLELGEGVTTCLFASRGRPFVVMWSPEGTHPATVELEPGAVRLDGLGRSFKARGPRVTLNVTGTPVVFMGVSDEYVAQAIRARFELYVTTEYGYVYNVDSPYVRALATDIKVGADDQAARMRATLIAALERMGTNYRRDTATLEPVALDIRASMVNLANAAVTRGSPQANHCTGLYRLQLMSEWFADVMDALRAPTETATQGADPDPWESLEQARAQLVDDQLGTMKGLSEAIIDRGFRMAEAFRRHGGHGAWLAAVTAREAALTFAQVDPAKVVDVFVIAYFPQARMMTKATLLPAGTRHTVEFEVHNFTPQPVSGTVRLTVPDTWATQEITADFSVEANSLTPRIPVQFEIPGSDDPWQLKWAYRPGHAYCVSIPPQLGTTVIVTAGGTLSDGRELLPTLQEVNVGTWVPDGTPPS